MERKDHEAVDDNLTAAKEEGEGATSAETTEVKSDLTRKQVKGAKAGFKVDCGKAEKAWFSASAAAGLQCDDASDCLKILDASKQLKADDELVDTTLMEGDGSAHLKMFGSRKDAAELLLLEAASLKSKGCFEWAVHLAHYHGDVGGALREWIESGHRVTEGMVNLAMATGYDVWKLAVVALSKQLVNDGDSLKAASYLLMINDVDEAVECLLRARQLRAAMTLARSRYESSDPKLKKVYLGCAEQYKADGDFGRAAKALVSAGEFLRASKFISTCVYHLIKCHFKVIFIRPNVVLQAHGSLVSGGGRNPGQGGWRGRQGAGGAGQAQDFVPNGRGRWGRCGWAEQAHAQTEGGVP